MAAKYKVVIEFEIEAEDDLQATYTGNRISNIVYRADGINSELVSVEEVDD